MSEFKRLLLVLEKELSHHEKLLDLLNQERVAIVKLNPEQLEKLNSEKEQVLEAAKECEGRRRELIDSIVSANENLAEASRRAANAAKRPATGAVKENGGAVNENGPVFAEIVGVCPQPEVRGELTKIGTDLRATAEVVRDMNSHNAQLIKQSLGLISSTLSIIRSAPGSELPTYGQSGTLRDSSEDPAFAGRSRGVTREA